MDEPIAPGELLHSAGVALFGEQYVAPLAATLKVDKNTVGKWAAGKSTVPSGVWSEIESALLKRKAAIDEAALLVRQRLDAQREAERRAPPGRIVVGRDPNDAFIVLSRPWTPRDRDIVQNSLDRFTGRHGLHNGTIADRGNTLFVDIPAPLDGDLRKPFEEWFNSECDRIEREG
jgi:hypothetical protein